MKLKRPDREVRNSEKSSMKSHNASLKGSGEIDKIFLRQDSNCSLVATKTSPDKSFDNSKKSDIISSGGIESGQDTNYGKNPRSILKFKLSEATVTALQYRGINELFPIQADAFPHIYAGKDLVGRARTGQGKTLAFCLPILEEMINNGLSTSDRFPKCLILSPTRELAKQIVAEFLTISPTLRIEALYGGVNIDENRQSLRIGVDVVVGTPGRIKDLLNRKLLNFSQLRHVVVDEADQMLDMGFQEDVQTIFDDMGDNPRQTCLFSATMPAWVHKLAGKYMKSDRVVVDLVESEDHKAVTTVRHIAIPTHWSALGSSINDVIAMYGGRKGRVLVFCQTKLDCDTIVLDKSVRHECQVLHGDIPQARRESTLAAYKDGHFRVLVATDVAARGLDMSVDLVIQAKPPVRLSGTADHEAYVHRSGRTGRAGRAGVCVT